MVEVTGATGALVQSLAFDAWGLRRNPADWAPLASPFGGTQPTKRGYTGHEHLDNVELIHMNGRVQDPKLGLFISADPFVQAPYNGQSLNRYSYVWNNPLTLVDPSGFQGARERQRGPETEPIPDGQIDPGKLTREQWLALACQMEPDLCKPGPGFDARACSASPELCNQRGGTPVIGAYDDEGGGFVFARDADGDAPVTPDTHGACAGRSGACHAPPVPVTPLDPRVVAAGSYIVEGVGWALVAFDVANTAAMVTAGPDTGLIGGPMIAAAQAARIAAKAIYLPAWRNVTVNMVHIAERHIAGGPFTAGRTVFPGMNETSVLRAIRQAYESSTKAGVQGTDRVKLVGQGSGLTIEMWFNKVTKTIESAYPINP